jgi:hypothetical protein
MSTAFNFEEFGYDEKGTQAELYHHAVFMTGFNICSPKRYCDWDMSKQEERASEHLLQM